MNRAIVFFDFSLSALPNLRRDSMSWCSTNTSVSAKTDITDFNLETKSGKPLRTTSFWQPYCPKALWSDSYFAQCLWSRSHFYRSFSFSFCRFLITIYFRFKISSFKKFILLSILFSIYLICESWFILTTSSCFFRLVL